MSRSDLLGVALALTSIGVLAAALELSPVSRAKFAKNYIYSGTGRRASRALSFSVLLLGVVLMLSWGLWSLIA
jgi:hypothetical protein